MPFETTLNVRRTLALVTLAIGILTWGGSLVGLPFMMLFETFPPYTTHTIFYLGPVLSIAYLLVKVLSLYIAAAYGRVTNPAIVVGLVLYAWGFLILVSYPSDFTKGMAYSFFPLLFGSIAMFIGLLFVHITEWARKT